MKPSPRFALTLLMIGLLHFQSRSQCTIQTITFDTTVTGSGTQDPAYIFNLPKFDGGLGTLTEIRISSVVHLTYEYTVENPKAFQQTHRLRLTRTDDVTSPALLTPPMSTRVYPSPSTFLLSPLDPSNGVPNSGSDFRAVSPLTIINNDTIIKHTVYNTADYIGTGTVPFEYSPYLSELSGPSGSGIELTASAQDQIRFALTYVYCSSPMILATDVTSFTATKKEDVVNIKWSNKNEQEGRKYELLKSYDGKTFVSVQKFNASTTGNLSSVYQYNYIPRPEEKGKLIFKLKLVENDGKEKYSSLRSVDLGNTEVKKGIRLLPNPSHGDVTILLSNAQRSDWQVDIYSITGQLIQRNQVNNAIALRLSGNTKLSAGAYVIRALNKNTNETSIERMLVK